MFKQLIPGVRITLALTLLTGLLYPGLVTGLCQLLFRSQANGSLILKEGRVAGSLLIGQNFARPEYFHPRPSSAGSDGYDASASSGSNLGPTSARLILGTTRVGDKKNEVVDFDGLSLRIVHYCVENDIPYVSSAPLDQFRDARGRLDDVKLIKAFNDKAPFTFTPKTPIPADAVTGSGSGLDPNISPANAGAQAARVARARGVSADPINQLIAQFTEAPWLGLLGDPRVNVLELNLALDQRFPSTGAPAAAAR
jgi:K+-transporting ATPase ATPase C chain